MLLIRVKMGIIVVDELGGIGLLVGPGGGAEGFFIAGDEMTDIDVTDKIRCLADIGTLVFDHIPCRCHAMVLEKLENSSVEDLFKAFFELEFIGADPAGQKGDGGWGLHFINKDIPGCPDLIDFRRT